MGSTTRGYRYPDGSGKVADGDLAIKALADDVEAKVLLVQSGTHTFASGPAAGKQRTQAIVFPTPYPVGVTPEVFCNPRPTSTTGPDKLSAGPDAVSNTGFTIRCVNTLNTNAVGVNWFARG